MPLRQDTTWARSVLARWFLPLLLGVAVLAMHGLGHPTGHGAHMAGMPGMAAAPAGAPPRGMQVAAVQSAASVPAMAGHDSHGKPEPTGLDPVGVCLAVLAATFLLCLPLLALRRRLPRLTRAAARVRAGALRAGRSPPGAPSLCALQVLRV